MPNTVDRFSNRVADYVAYRPGYPKEIINFLKDTAGLSPDWVIADIGSGTGISAKLFLENGNTVYGVEPNAAMRGAAEVFLKDFPNFKSIDGNAENTNLPDKSIHVIVAAQAFHWFDREKTPLEFRRILKEDGLLALIWNERQLDSTDFLREYERFLLEYGTDYSAVRHDQVTKETLIQIFNADFYEASFLNSQVLDFEGLKGRMRSASYMPSADSPRYEQMIEDLKALFARHAKDGKIEIIYDTNIYMAQI